MIDEQLNDLQLHAGKLYNRLIELAWASNHYPKFRRRTIDKWLKKINRTELRKLFAE